MAKDYEGNLSDGGWKLAQDWKLDDLVANPAEHGRQDVFAKDVGTFLQAGRTSGDDAGDGSGTPATPNGAGSGTSVGKADSGGAPPFDNGMAQGLQAFMKAGQTTGEGFSATTINSPGNGDGQSGAAGGAVQGQGQEARGSVGAYEVRGSVESPENAPAKPSPGSYTQRDLFDMLKGYDPESRDYQRQQQERENWEKLKGIDPETRAMLHGPRWPANGGINSPYGERRDPFTGEKAFHRGIDISNPVGADVVASESGKVVSIAPGNKYGENQVIVQNRDGAISIYAHTTPKVKPGMQVYSGDVLGITDLSGRSTGGHVHYGIKDPKTGHFDPVTRLPKR